MKKIKLLKIVSITTPVLLTPLLANSCSNNSNTKYDPFNLSTWGNKEKTAVENVIFQTAKNWLSRQNPPYTGWYFSDWVGTYYGSNNEGSALRWAFDQINPDIVFKNTADKTANVSFTRPKFAAKTDLIDVFKDGYNYVVKGNGFFIKGSITIHEQGSLV